MSWIKTDRKHGRFTIKGAFEQSTLFGDLGELAEGHQLEAPAVLFDDLVLNRHLETSHGTLCTTYGEQVVPPALKFVRTSRFLEYIDAGAEIEMICVIEDKIDSQRLHLLWCQTLNRSLRSHRHESR